MREKTWRYAETASAVQKGAYIVAALIVDVADVEGLRISQVVCVPGGPVTAIHSTCLPAHQADRMLDVIKSADLQAR